MIRRTRFVAAVVAPRSVVMASARPQPRLAALSPLTVAVATQSRRCGSSAAPPPPKDSEVTAAATKKDKAAAAAPRMTKPPLEGTQSVLKPEKSEEEPVKDAPTEAPKSTDDAAAPPSSADTTEAKPSADASANAAAEPPASTATEDANAAENTPSEANSGSTDKSTRDNETPAPTADSNSSAKKGAGAVPPTTSHPRGFEHFFDKRFKLQSDTTPDVAYKGIDQTEEIMSRAAREEAQSKKRRTTIFFAVAGFGLYLLYAQDSSRIVRWVMNSSWLAPHMSIRALDRAAEAADQRRVLNAIVGSGGESSGDKQKEDGQNDAASEIEAEQDLALSIKEGTRRVRINVDKHVAKLYDDAGHLLCVSSFIDVRALKQQISVWRNAIVEQIPREVPAAAATSSSSSEKDDATEKNDGDDDEGAKVVAKMPEFDEVTVHKAPEMMYTVPSHFPFAAICFLWLLPVLVSVHRSLTMQVKAAGVAANKAPGSKNTRFKLQKDIKTKLADVAGLTEVKHEVTEIVHMLKKPEHYTRLGARVPRGVLIDGPPGVGKTLLAKAVAGEAGLPFMSCSGSEFDEVYVGVGAKRVRELFATAKKHKPCIIFIDEIDTFGKKRRNDRNGSSRATINALLNELDGFTESTEVTVLAATNRADTLDEALTRSGRFDRKISVDMPPHSDRVAIAKVHLAPITLNAALTVDSVAETLATMTPGCSGADIYNICNEAAITASRLDKEAVDLDCFTIAMDRIMIGMEKKAKSLTTTERERIAFHEAGKVVLTWFLETTDPVLKSTIASRGGRRSGVTKKLPKDRFINTQVMLRERMIHQLGGYVSEEHFFEDVSSNAAEDLRQVTNMAHHEIATYGMDPANVGHFGWQENDQAIQKPYGAHKADQIDHAVQHITEEVMRRARDLRQTHLDKIRIVAGLLLKNETVTARELWTVLGERPHMTAEFRKYLETAAA